MASHGFQRAWLIALSLLLVLWLRPGISRADPDPWLGRDKALHFSFSAAIAVGGYGATALLGDDTRWRVWGGAGAAILAGVGKEVVDIHGPGDASFKDLTWDLIGTATGVGVAWLIDRCFFHSM
jgi:putative lipoprotein